MVCMCAYTFCVCVCVSVLSYTCLVSIPQRNQLYLDCTYAFLAIQSVNQSMGDLP